MHITHYLPRTLAKPLEGLATLALDLRWCWHHGADTLWRTIDAELWTATANPWLILETVSEQRLHRLARDAQFLELLRGQLAARQAHLQGESWFGTHHARSFRGSVAYFSMEFGLGESLPIYSGGLGVLAGDHLKTACDLGVPLVGVGLLYQRGYFRQAVDAHGEQIEFYPYNDPSMLPVVPLRDAQGEWVRITVELPGRPLRLRTWLAQAGRRSLFLLDSNDPLNDPADRGITGELYGGGQEMRLQQEIVLGIGGWRLLQALQLDCPVCHLNEGHAAFAVLERARHSMEHLGQPFGVALRATRAGNLFTTHTPVEAGFDRFPPDLFAQYFNDYAEQLGIGIERLLGLGRATPSDVAEPFNMAYLAVRGAGAVNAVSRLHGAVSRRIFQPLFPRWPEPEVPVTHVTNGVHVPSWDSAAADTLWTAACGKPRWQGEMEAVEAGLRRLDAAALWSLRAQGRRQLVEFLRTRLVRQTSGRGVPATQVAACARWLDPDALTLGFARRFAEYKRTNLLLRDPERLTRLLTDRDRPVQLVIAGKAHPRDADGKRLLREWSEFVRRPHLCTRVAFVEDYDLSVAAALTQGVDVWINTPRRPWEASGTSGMKVLVNGGLNLSELDGWWAEAYAPDVGWALGDGREHSDIASWDALEADQLYRMLEDEVVPCFYRRDARGLPQQWIARMRESMARLTPRFSSNRMVREYTETFYVPLAARYRQRAADGGQVAVDLEQWQALLARHWARLRFGNVSSQHVESGHEFRVEVYLDDLPPDAVRVELYAEPLDGGEPVRRPMVRTHPLPETHNAFVYTATIPADRLPSDYTPRLVPEHAAAALPLEANLILWQR
jgi:starch phosphorylase